MAALTTLPEWAERTVAPKLSGSERIVAFVALRDTALSKLGLVETDSRAFVAEKRLTATDVFEIPTARGVGALSGPQLACGECGATFTVTTPAELTRAYCVACGHLLLGATAAPGPPAGPTTRKVRAPAPKAKKTATKAATAPRVPRGAGPGEPGEPPKKRRRRGPGEL